MPNEKEINALELRKHFGEILDQVHAQRQTYIVTKNGRPVMALVNISVYQELTNQPASPQAAAAPVSAPAPAEQKPEANQEDNFIELYTQERIAEFLREDTLRNPDKPR